MGHEIFLNATLSPPPQSDFPRNHILRNIQINRSHPEDGGQVDKGSGKEYIRRKFLLEKGVLGVGIHDYGPA